MLYPGSFVDVAASMVFDNVAYVDVDSRAASFFDDAAGVREIVGRESTWSFELLDYRDPLPFDDGSFDGLVSLYAGFVSEACLRYLRVGGWLLVNPSHGDVAMASASAQLELAAVVAVASGDYRISDTNLDAYLIPKSSDEPTIDEIRERGRGIAYTRSAFAYLFERVN